MPIGFKNGKPLFKSTGMPVLGGGSGCGTVVDNCAEFNSWLSDNGYLGASIANATLVVPPLENCDADGSFSVPKVSLTSGALWEETVTLNCPSEETGVMRQVFVNCQGPFVRVQANYVRFGTSGYLGDKDFSFPFDVYDIFGQTHNLQNGVLANATVTLP